MGSWTATVSGHGIHDNGRDDDADALFDKFVKDLEKSGHTVKVATFVSGGGRDFKTGEYL